MQILINISAFIFTFLIMEFVAWWSHKNIMHGLLWRVHSDHHIKTNKQTLEMNDLFALIFAVPSMILLAVGFDKISSAAYFWVGLGILFYGIAYFFVHDIFIHQRIKMFKNISSPYLTAMRKAHKIHHKKLVKEDCEYFGFLWVPRKFYQMEKSINNWEKK